MKKSFERGLLIAASLITAVGCEPSTLSVVDTSGGSSSDARPTIDGDSRLLGRRPTVRWSRHGAEVYGWRIRVGTDDWPERYGDSGTAGPRLGSFTVASDLPEDDSEVLVRLEYANDPGWATDAWVVADERIFVSPARDSNPNEKPSYTLAELGQVTPELPATPQIPPLPDSSCTNLAFSEFYFPDPNDSINWRRNTTENNPIAWLTMAASDSDLSSEQRAIAWDAIVARFERTLSESLPQIDAAGINNQDQLLNYAHGVVVNNGFSEPGTWAEHALVTYFIPYAELTKRTDAADAVVGHARWMLWQQQSGDRGFEQYAVNSADSTFYARAWMRRLKNLIVFSDSQLIPFSLRTALAQEATRMLSNFLARTADGSVDDIGWDDSRNAHYVHQAASATGPQYRGKRVVHMRFHEIWNGILVQLRNTGYYAQHTALIDDAIAKTRATTNTVISSTGAIRFPEGGSIPVSLANYRVEGWFFDEFAAGSCPSFDGVCHEILPTPSSAYKPKEFWLSVDNPTTHALLVENTCTEWIPSFRYLPGPVAAYSGI